MNAQLSQSTTAVSAPQQKISSAPSNRPEPPARPATKVAQKSANKSDKEPPPAPTTDRPPFPFGASPSPHGVPTYNGPNELTQEKLNPPDPNKRRKTNSNAAGAAGSGAKDQISPNQAAKPSKTATPQVSRTETSFKCPVPQCEGAKKGFPTKEALAKHHDQVHKEKDPEDPLAFAMEQARNSLGLDAQGKSNNKRKAAEMENPPTSESMKQSLSAQGPTTNKLEAGTPMSRSLTGHPRTGDGPKTLASDLVGAASKATPSKQQSTARRDGHEEDDPNLLWQSSRVTQEALRDLFPLPSDVQGSMNFNSLTPASTISTTTTKSEKNSPKANESTDIDVVMVNNEPKNWLPPAFFNDVDVDQSFIFPDDDTLSMSWETVLPPKTQTEKVTKTLDGKLAKKKPRNTVDDPVFDVNLFSFNPN